MIFHRRVTKENVLLRETPPPIIHLEDRNVECVFSMGRGLGMKPSFKCQSDLKNWKVFTVLEPPEQPAGSPGPVHCLLMIF